MTEQAPAGGGESERGGTEGSSSNLVIDFDNRSDPDATVVSIEGENQVDVGRGADVSA